MWNVIDKAKTSLVDSKLNKQMKDYTNEQAFELLSSVGKILDELVFPKDREEEEEIETNECDISRSIRDSVLYGANTMAENVDAVSKLQIADDDANRAIEPNIDEPDMSDDDVSKKLGYNRFMISSPWKHGARLLMKDNIKQT